MLIINVFVRNDVLQVSALIKNNYRFTYSRNAECLEVFIRKDSFCRTVRVTFNYAKCGAGLVHYNCLMTFVPRLSN